MAVAKEPLPAGGDGLRRQPERSGAVGVEVGEVAVDVDGVGAVDVHILVVGGPDVGEDLVVDVAAVAPQSCTALDLVDLVEGSDRALRYLKRRFKVRECPVAERCDPPHRVGRDVPRFTDGISTTAESWRWPIDLARYHRARATIASQLYNAKER